MSYNKEKNIGTKVDVPEMNGMVGIRATLNNMGIKNSSIGFDDKSSTVTLDGKAFMKPDHYDSDAGITYASPDKIKQSVADFYKSSKEPVVKVSDAYTTSAGKYGLDANAMGYSDGVVTIGGKPIDILYIDDDGKAWARSSVVEDAVEEYASSLGTQSPTDILDMYNKKYMPMLDKLTNRLVNTKEFSYDPDEDPVYQAYREKYLREGARVTEDTMAIYAGLTGGYTNSMAVTAGALAEQEYAKKATDAIPDFASLAYSRYVDKYNRDAKTFENILKQYDLEYKNAMSANNQVIENANKTIISNTDRDKEAFERYWEDRKNRQEESEDIQEQYWQNIFNNQKQRDNDLEFAINSLERDKIKRYLENYFDAMSEGELTEIRLKNQKLAKELSK